MFGETCVRFVIFRSIRKQEWGFKWGEDEGFDHGKDSLSYFLIEYIYLLIKFSIACIFLVNSML